LKEGVALKGGTMLVSDTSIHNEELRNGAEEVIDSKEREQKLHHYIAN
jgi:hypothetical protein